MSSCLSSRACGFDLEHMVKWQPYGNSSRTTSTSNTSSPSSTLSNSSNSPVTISNQKPRTPRKRPNQTYNEAAALLSMASPNIFKIKHLTKRTTNLSKFTKHLDNFGNEPPELIFFNSQIIKKPCFLTDLKTINSCRLEQSKEYLDDFDTELILNDEIEQGIDSIMGDCTAISENHGTNDTVSSEFHNCCYGYPMGLGFGVRNRVRALKNADDRHWWKFPMVEVVNTSPAAIVNCERSPAGKKKKTVPLRKLVLKLDYDGVLNDWAGKGSPVPEEIIHAKAANIDIFSEDGGWKESSATRSLDNNNLKKIRPVKNACSDKRPRCKGRFDFVEKPNSSVYNEV
ncbi:hypothetical protein HanPI659440_Chr05g0191091 [Helianthus annuus]|nr:hypothetical protein HanPI659440_Chr05g0191091 [Helianthus annuus]